MSSMAHPPLLDRIRAVLAECTDEERGGVEKVELTDEPTERLFDEEEVLPAEVVVNDDGDITLVVDPTAWGPSPDDALVRSVVVQALNRWHEDLAVWRELDSEEALFREHAAFRRGDPTLPGWYRSGEPYAPRMWRVDLDLFAEFVVSPTKLDALRGKSVTMRIDDASMELSLPDEVEVGDYVAILEAGAMDEVDEDEEAADDESAEPSGRCGDLHVIFYEVEPASGTDA